MTETSLLTKYRPSTFAEVVGQDKVVVSLTGAIKKRSSHAFLLTGPSGTGKTTLARIAAAELGCQEVDLMEIDAATYTGIDDMRGVMAQLFYRPMGEGAVKVVIIDESHMLSKNAWASLLKTVEHPPDWAYWFFCTTEAGKVPANIKTRCLAYELKPVASLVLGELLLEINEAEKLSVDGTVIALCAKEANGSPRQAIANLAVCVTAKTRTEAAELLRSAEESEPVIALARALYNGARWPELQRIVGQLGDINAEGVRQVVRAYGTKIVLSTQKEAAVGRALEILAEFSEPFNSHDGLTPVILACGRLTLS